MALRTATQYAPRQPVDVKTGDGGERTWWQDLIEHHRRNLEREWTQFIEAAKEDLTGRVRNVDRDSAGAVLWDTLYHKNRERWGRYVEQQGERFGRSEEGKRFKEGVIREEIGSWLENPVFWFAAVALVILVKSR